jgi:hypothetical protein
MKAIFDVSRAIEAQSKYCEENNVIQFAPYTGICYSCKHQIYNIISVEEAEKTHITDCPICNKDYCD